MKLLQKTMVYNIAITVVLLLVAGMVMYCMLKREIIAEMKEQLELQVNDIHKYIERGNAVQYPLVTVEKVGDEIPPAAVFRDTLINDVLQQKKEDYYYLVSTGKNATGNYRITVMTTYIGWNEYSSTIFILLFFTAIALTALNLLANHWMNKRMWQPFFNNLHHLKQFSVSSDQPIQLEHSDIVEFKELRRSLQDIADRGQKEYKALREFTENAAHEIQTPLGIIQSKLDHISQADIGEALSAAVVQAKSGVERLKKINRGLLLLAKLDNNAFPEKKDVYIDRVVKQQFDVLEELLSAKGIKAELDLQPLLVHANVYLTDILVTNLLSNAIRYASSGSVVVCTTRADFLSIINSGPPIDFPTELLFQRFRKSNQHAESTGLGLSIVSQICQLNNWEISYDYQEGEHVFVVQTA
ncbi:MAG: sensor histidine kinase [Agriterribacter sp.]